MMLTSNFSRNNDIANGRLFCVINVEIQVFSLSKIRTRKEKFKTLFKKELDESNLCNLIIDWILAGGKLIAEFKGTINKYN